MSDIGQGSQPVRVTSIRSLPDVDVTDTMEGIEDNTKDRLTREHIVCMNGSEVFLSSYT